MKVVLLAGGLGTRLREETEFKPKPMVEVGGYPIIWHIMNIFSSYDLNDFIVCLGYKGDVIKNYFLNFQTQHNDFSINTSLQNSVKIYESDNLSSWDVTLANTGIDSMTGERIRRIKQYIPKGETFIMTYGDGLSDIDINELLTFHNSHDGIATISTTKPSSRFGMVEIGENNRILDFKEKPLADGNINMGFMVLDYEVFEYIEEGDVFEERPLKKLAESGKLFSYFHDGYFEPMDTYRENLSLNQLWKNGNAPWKKW
jgi:glucose-1-phosphate cytidylyltransferase|tara:strand:+ start:497 stop:1270 length:774 start_codon:yes stop_codon:yes gene_type:complete